MKKLINKVFDKVKWQWRDLLFQTGVRSIASPPAGGIILVYHGVTRNTIKGLNSRFISADSFEKHLAFFKSHFNLISVNDYFEGNFDSERLNIAITFDDGYLNNLTVALPILEKYQAPATFYVTTIRQKGYDILWPDALDLHRLNGPLEWRFNGKTYRKGKHEYERDNQSLKSHLKRGGWAEKQRLVEQILSESNFMNNPDFYPYFKLMDAQDIQQLSLSTCADIGSHGLYHNCFDSISIEEVENELRTSKDYLEKIIKKPVDSIAFPDGKYTTEILNLAENLGFKTQLAVDYIYPEDAIDKRVKERMGINPYISFKNQMDCIIRGNYQ